MPTVTIRRQLEVSTSPEQVWDVVSDFERHHEWHVGLKKLQLISPKPLGLGSTLILAETFPWGDCEWEFEIQEWLPNRRVHLHTRSGKPTGDLILSEERTETGTLITYEARFQMPYWILGWLVFKLRYQKEAIKHIDIDLKALKDYLETIEKKSDGSQEA